MKSKIVAKSLELGFQACRVTTAAPPDSSARFTQWLQHGAHGDMAYLERTAPKRVNPQLVLPGARSILALAVSYPSLPKATLRPQTSSPTGLVARYARATDYHETLAPRLRELSQFLNHLGGPDCRSLWYLDTGPILERDLAQRAGIGFIGKHTNLIGRRLGNWFFLAEILTTLDLPPDPPETNHCGRCTRCLTACPTQAITAPFHLDARRCISYLTIELKGPIPLALRPALSNRIFGCDDCLEACPWNRFAQSSRLLQSNHRQDLEEPDLLELLSLDEAAFKSRFAHTPLARPKRRGLLRNVCVALGNVASPTALPALNRAAQDPEPLIAEHARWAIDQIQSRQSAAS